MKLGTKQYLVYNIVLKWVESKIIVTRRDGHRAGYPKPNRLRTAWNRPGAGTVTFRDRFRTGTNRTIVEKKLSEPWNRWKKTAWIGLKNRGPESVLAWVNRPNDSMELEPEPVRVNISPTVSWNQNQNLSGWTGPKVPWNRNRKIAVASRCKLVYKYISLSIIGRF